MQNWRATCKTISLSLWVRKKQSDGESCAFTLELTVRQTQVRCADDLKALSQSVISVLNLYIASNSHTGE